MPQIVSIAPSAKFFPNPRRGLAGTSYGLVSRTFFRLWADLRRRRRERITCGILGRLDDRTLHDIGIQRSEIGSVVRTQAAEHRVHYDQLY